MVNVVAEAYMANAHKEGYHKHTRPQHSVGQYLKAVDMVQQPPVKGKKTPDTIAEQSVDESFLVF